MQYYYMQVFLHLVPYTSISLKKHTIYVCLRVHFFKHAHIVSDAYTVKEYYLCKYTYHNNLSMLGYSMLGMLLIKLNLENK